VSNSVEQYWYRTPERVPFWLKILSRVFRVLAFIRRVGFLLFFFRVYRPKIPVIVVGNINVGGTGKTPFTAWLVKRLKKAGLKPGIVSRGYGGQASHWPQQVRPDSDPTMVGDEAVLLARHCECPMAVAPERVTAIKELIRYNDIDVIISDDGMQHYAMGRDLEIAIIDGERRFGNGYCLPAGPLREPVSRLERVDYCVTNGGKAKDREYAMQLVVTEVINVANPNKKISLDTLRGKSVHAVAGIGNPQRFFDQVKTHGLNLQEHAFEDHHRFVASDFNFVKSDDVVLMTEKDAVKCERFAGPNFWFVRVRAEVSNELSKQIISQVEKKLSARKHRWTASYSTS